MITGNRTDDGAVVYLAADGRWVTDLTDAHAIEGDEEVQTLIARAHTQERVVCDPYPISVAVEGDTPRGLSAREEIRSVGPSVSYRRPDSPTEV